VLVVHDEDDEETPWQGGVEVARAWPRGELLSTRGLGHRRLLRDAKVVAAVSAFVGRAAASGSGAGPAAPVAVGA
jgi:hypothetical protein